MIKIFPLFLLLAWPSAALGTPPQPPKDSCRGPAKAILVQNKAAPKAEKAIPIKRRWMKFVHLHEDTFEGWPETQKAVEQLSEQNPELALIPEGDILPRALDGGNPRVAMHWGGEGYTDSFWIEDETLLAKYESLREAQASFYTAMVDNRQWVDTPEIASTRRELLILEKQNLALEEKLIQRVQEHNHKAKALDTEQKKKEYWDQQRHQVQLRDNIRFTMRGYQQLLDEQNRLAMIYSSIKQLDGLNSVEADRVARSNYRLIKQIFRNQLDAHIDLEELHYLIQQTWARKQLNQKFRSPLPPHLDEEELAEFLDIGSVDEIFDDFPGEFKKLGDYYQLQGLEGHITNIDGGEFHRTIFGHALSSVFFDGTGREMVQSLQEEFFAESAKAVRELRVNEASLETSLDDDIQLLNSYRYQLLAKSGKLIFLQAERYEELADTTLMLDLRPEFLGELYETIIKLIEQIGTRESMIDAQLEKGTPLEVVRRPKNDGQHWEH